MFIHLYTFLVSFFYYGTNTELIRADLSNVQVSATMCKASINGATTLRVFTSLYDFTILQNEAIYTLGCQSSICNENNTGLIIPIILGRHSNEIFGCGNSIGINELTRLETFTQYIVVATNNTITFVSIDNTVSRCNSSQNVRVLTTYNTVPLIRMIRQSHQPSPGTLVCSLLCAHPCINKLTYI